MSMVSYFLLLACVHKAHIRLIRFYIHNLNFLYRHATKMGWECTGDGGLASTCDLYINYDLSGVGGPLLGRGGIGEGQPHGRNPPTESLPLLRSETAV